MVKCPNWREADQLAIYGHGRGVELVSTEKQLQLIAVRARLEPVTSGLLIRTTQSRCLLINFSSFNSFDVKAF